MSSTGMTRLVYAPRAYVFVKSKDGKIHDLSRYVTAGSVTRLIDQVSSAEITLRNPNHLFTVHVEDGEVVEPIFTPMDPITIFLRRVRNRPVRVFTGFLDKVPYLQLYPGTVTFEASCTLKRLLNTYFDPALPYTMSFLTTYGWVPYNGQWVSLTGMKEWLAPGTDGTPTSGANSSATPAPTGAGDKNISVYGDSIAQGMVSQLSRDKSLKITSNTKVGRPSSVGANEIPKMKNLSSTVVIALGSNDDPSNPAAFKSNVHTILDSIGSKHHVIWINFHGSNYLGNSITPLNAALSDVIAGYSNATILDWHQISEDKNVQFDSHGLHPNTGGYRILADAVSGQISSGASSANDANKLQPPKNVDGSLSQLLFATLKHIGNWDSKDIYIEAMPEKLFDHLRDLATEFANDDKQAQEEMKTLFKNILGGGAQGTPTAGQSSVDLTGVNGDVAQQVYEVGVRMHMSRRILLSAMVTGLDESGMRNLNYGTGSSVGWRQELAEFYGSVANRMNVPKSAERYFNEAKAHDHGQAADQLAYDVQRPAGYPNGGNPYTKFLNEGETLLNKLEMKNALTVPTNLGTLPPSNSANNGPRDSGVNSDANQTIRGSTTGKSTKGSGATKIYAPIPGWGGQIGGVYGEARSSPHPHIHAGVDIDVPRGTPCVAPTDGTIGIAASGGFAPGEGGPDGAGGGMVHFIFDNDVGDIKAGTVIGWGHIEKLNVARGQKVKAGQVIAKSGWTNGGDHVHFIARHDDNAEDGYQDKSLDPTPIFRTLEKGEATPTGDASPIGSSSGSGSTASDPTAQGTAAAGAFFAALDLPSVFDAVEASMLTGEKSLLNDKPLMPFIQQICSASLRHFQSLPDGRFYAFYPDYFGEMLQHPAYWEIDDIEILDGKIELTDDSLVTHMYVVGDTVNPMGGDTPFAMRSVFSSGVVTIFNAFMANSVLDRTKARKKDTQAAQRKAKKHKATKNDNIDGMGILLDRQEAADFLNRYGARPAMEDMPMIRSPYYEMFLAYQKFLLAWSKQFSTPFAFTFMPELFPGGKVAFESHGLQMYIEQVNHSWDYEGGFTTSASLTAPSAYGKKTGLLPPNMVQAIIAPPTPARGAAD